MLSHLKISSLLVLLFASVSCTNLSKGITFQQDKLLTGTFECPGYQGKDNQWNPSISKKILLNFEGTPILLETTNSSNAHKYGSYTTRASIMDGQWRYATLFRAGKLYPIKAKAEIKNNVMYWEAQYPELKTKSGEIRKPKNGKGKVWIDKNGNLSSEGTHYTGVQTCKRVK